MLVRRLKVYSIATVCLAIIDFVVILCITLADNDISATQDNKRYVLAALFWICLIVQCVFVCLSSIERRKAEQKGYKIKNLNRRQIGIISFFKNLEATVTDITLIVLTAICVILALMHVESGAVIAICISVLFLSFNLHCIFNGKNYRYLKAYIIYSKEHERDG